ncbi:MAG: glycosyltransferase family 4 protein [Patescibacteria group bacterium]
MKILICTGIYPPDIGGPATYSKLIHDELTGRGILTKVLSFGSVRSLPKIIRHFVYFLKTLEIGRSIDVIFALDPVSVGLPSVLAAKILKKKFVLRVAGDYAWEQYMQKSDFKTLEEFQKEKYDFITELRRKIQKWVAKKADKIIVPSQYLKKIVSMWGINEKKISVVYNSFTAPAILLSKDEARKKLSLSGTILISVGRFVPWKGFSALIEIMPEILKINKDIKLFIIGEGPEIKILENQIDCSVAHDSIFLLEAMGQDDLMAYLKAGDILILNSAYEGFSHLILEAMAMEIPVITTKVGGNPEIVINQETGILVEYNNKDQIKRAILNLISDENLRKKITSKAKEKVQEFKKEKMIQETLEVFKNT